MKEFDYSTVKDYKLYNFVKNVFKPLIKMVFHTEYKGLENIPPKGTKYILAHSTLCLLPHQRKYRPFTLWARQNFSKIRFWLGL